MIKSRNAARWLGSGLTLCLLTSLLLAACGDTATPLPDPNKTPTADASTRVVQPSATAIPVTATPVPPTATPLPKPPEPLYLAIIINQYQQATGGENGGQSRSLRDFYGLTAQLEKNAGMKLTFSLGGTLLRQVGDSNAPGVADKDRFTAIAAKNAALLTPDEKLFMLGNFFEVGEAQVVRFPRFLELRRKRGDRTDAASLNRVIPLFTEEDWRDLQVVYNLSALPPEVQQAEPISSIISKVVGFSEDDKVALSAALGKLNRNVLEKYQKLQKSGQIEVITSPYAYPIVPLLVDGNAAREGNGGDKAVLPEKPYAYPADVTAQIKKSQALIKASFGTTPVGLLPPEGAVSEASLPVLKASGISWIVSDETVLARSLNLPRFTRDANQTAQPAARLYQPYQTANSDGKPLTVFFRDQILSELMGSGYATKPAPEAAKDFIARLKAIPGQLKSEGLEASEPRIVTLVLDGNSAFSGYPNNGDSFLQELFSGLAAEKNIKPITPGEYIQLRPATAKLGKLATGSWSGDNLEQWVGQTDKNKAWNYLTQARAALDPYLKGEKATPAANLEKAADWLYLAQSSGIFRSLGEEDSDEAMAADQTFRANLLNAFKELGQPVPDYLNVPITPNAALAPNRPVADFISPQVNGRVSDKEWEDAGLFSENIPAPPTAQTGTPPPPGPSLTATYFGWDDKNVYFRVDSNRRWSDIDPLATVSVYLSAPRQKDESKLNFVSRNSTKDKRTVLGFGAGYELEMQVDSKKNAANAQLSVSTGGNGWQVVEKIEPVFAGSQTIEIALPWKSLPQVEPGGKVYFTAVLNKAGTDLQQVPSAGAGTLRVPDSFGLTSILSVKDREGDDHGPGPYIYPVNRLYKPGIFDLTDFSVAKDEAKNLIIKLRVAGPLENPLKAPNGFSFQTFDVYIRNPRSKDPAAAALLPGRNARVGNAEAWQYAIVAEGWEAAIYKLDKQGQPIKSDLPLKLSVSAADRTLTIKVPLAGLGDDPENWFYLPAVLGQDSNPAPGVLRVKDVEVSSSPDKFGGAPNNPSDGNHTRILDIIIPSGGQSQEALLDNYKPSPELDPAKLDPTTFALLSMLRPRR